MLLYCVRVCFYCVCTCVEYGSKIIAGARARLLRFIWKESCAKYVAAGIAFCSLFIWHMLG